MLVTLYFDDCTVVISEICIVQSTFIDFQEKAGALVSYTEAKPPKPDGLTGVFITV